MRNAQGRTLGHLAVLHTAPMSPSDADVDALQIFAARGCAELERKQADERLRKAHAELRRTHLETQALLNITRAIGHHLQRDVLFGALTDCLRGVVPADCFAIALPHAPGQLQVFVLTSRNRRGEGVQPQSQPSAGSAAAWAIAEREPHLAGAREEVRTSFLETWRMMEQEQLESLCVLPLIAGERVRGALLLMAAAKSAYSEERSSFYRQIAEVIAVALDDCLAHEEMRRLADELSARQIATLEKEKGRVERERTQLQAQNIYLQEEIRSQHNFVEIVGNSPALLSVLRQVDQVAPTESTVLILGETGTGKELIARAIHDRSARRERPLVKVNCGAISAGLVESELFGHVKGAFTGALTSREGRFALADGGTIFLDEVGELPLETQVKLLRVLQEQEFEPVGGSKTVKVNVRVIAATHRDLTAMLREGKFRSDLYYRLNVFPLTMPALRERPEDVPLLTMFFLERFACKLGRPIAQVAEETMARLCAYAWPGNIRELQNLIERAAVLATGPVLQIDESSLEFSRTAALGDLAALAPAAAQKPADASLEEVERQHILSILAQTKWQIEGKAGAASLLNLQPSTLRSRMQRLGIARRR
jgi:formate hydrogenlyase transcriptional activator